MYQVYPVQTAAPTTCSCNPQPARLWARLGEHRNIVPVRYMYDAQATLPIILGLGLFDLEGIAMDKRPATLLQKCT